jgi:hypothetical protein
LLSNRKNPEPLIRFIWELGNEAGRVLEDTLAPRVPCILTKTFFPLSCLTRKTSWEKDPELGALGRVWEA